MKIPGGYGWVRLSCYVNGIYQAFNFYNVSENPVMPREVATSYIDINHTVQKHIQGHQLDFNMMLIDKNLSSGTQNEMNNFLKSYHSRDNLHSDRRIGLYPVYDDTGSGWASVFSIIGQIVILTEEPYITDICNYKFAGQVLVLKGQTRNLITEDDYSVRVYRESSTGAWGLYNAPCQGYFEPYIGMTA